MNHVSNVTIERSTEMEDRTMVTGFILFSMESIWHYVLELVVVAKSGSSIMNTMSTIRRYNKDLVIMDVLPVKLMRVADVTEYDGSYLTTAGIDIHLPVANSLPIVRMTVQDIQSIMAADQQRGIEGTSVPGGKVHGSYRCGISQDPISETEAVVKLACGHLFKPQNIIKCMRNVSACPVCSRVLYS